jgi:hypothetical protein
MDTTFSLALLPSEHASIEEYRVSMYGGGRQLSRIMYSDTWLHLCFTRNKNDIIELNEL